MSIPFSRREELSGTRIRYLIATDQKWDDLVPKGTKNFLVNVGAQQRLKNL